MLYIPGLTRLELTVALAATDAVIQKKTFRSAMTTLVFSYEDLNEIMKIVS